MFFHVSGPLNDYDGDSERIVCTIPLQKLHNGDDDDSDERSFDEPVKLIPSQKVQVYVDDSDNSSEISTGNYSTDVLFDECNSQEEMTKGK